MDPSLFYQSAAEKKTINWKDPQVRQLLDDFIDGKLPLRNIPEFANHVNKICNTAITLSTIRNRVYQEQRERKLLLKGMQVAASFPSSTTPTTTTNSLTSSLCSSLAGTPKPMDSILAPPPPDPEPVSLMQAIQAVPIHILQNDEILQTFAFVTTSNDSNQMIMLSSPDGMQINNNNSNISNNSDPTTTMTQNQYTILTSSSPAPEISPANLKLNSEKPPKIPKLRLTRKRKNSYSLQDPKKPSVKLTDEPLDNWRPQLEAFYSPPDLKFYTGPEAPANHKLPNEFLQHFNSETFKVDMDSLKQLSMFVREKLDYIENATKVYFPDNYSFNTTNSDAFKRNLDVIKQAGDYFEPLLAFENDPKFFPDSLTEIGTAISICAQNGTAMIDQFSNPSMDKEILPGSSLTKNGMNNLCILLNGILMEAESLITEYDKLKLNLKVNKTKMMMLTLQFARYYKLSGEIAKAGMVNSKNKKLTDQLNKLNITKLDGFVEEEEDIQITQEMDSNVINLGDSPINNNDPNSSWNIFDSLINSNI